jgi:hypothetical protein
MYYMFSPGSFAKELCSNPGDAQVNTGIVLVVY